LKAFSHGGLHEIHCPERGVRVCVRALAHAQYADGPYRYGDRAEYARVIEATPVYASSSREECWNPSTGTYEARRDSSSGIGKGAAIRALAGGVLGHQIDDGAGTVAGAILGGIVGNEIEKRSERSGDLDVSRCRYASDNSIEGYDVRYRYRGNEYVTRMANDPGSRLSVGGDINSDGTPFDQVGVLVRFPVRRSAVYRLLSVTSSPVEQTAPLGAVSLF
jgi:uncharacterized protein YcfJ